MRILIVGSDKSHAIEKVFEKYIKELGTDVCLFAATSIFYDYYYKNIFNKLKYRAGASSIFKTINNQFKSITESFAPQVIWVFKGMELFPETLLWAKNKGIRLVNYNPDNPFIFSGKGSGNKNLANSIKYYNLHFTYNLAIEQELQKKHAVKTAFLPFGFDVRDELYNQCVAEPEISKVCFLGNPDTKRASFLNNLAANGIRIDVFGNDWNKFVHHENIQCFDAVYDDVFWKTLRRYRVQINLMRIHNENSHNMRTFEVPGIGGIMVAPDTAEHRIFFENEKEVFLFSNAAHCAELISAVLLLTDAEAGMVRLNARNRSITAGYTYKERARFALQTIDEIR